MKFFNTNLLHNFLNVALVVIPALETFDWTPFMSDQTALKVVGVLGLLKIAVNVLRDGPTGLASPQPPVEK
ncbi:hypothetical protein [Shinella sp. M27]|uniref:hypothetical protein n=1 Tax=Shinella sp. M27 TaxID=3368614 RepID=UPI003B9F5E92